MIWLLLILTHLACVWLGRVVTLRAARRWPDPPHLEDVMPHPGEHHHRHSFGVDNSGETPQEGKARRNLRDNGRLAVALLMASIFVLIIGAQAYLDRRDNAADDKRIEDAISALEDTTACIRTWGVDFAETTTTRTGGSTEKGTVDLERAEKRRDDALDEIILTVIAARSIPPTAGADDFDRVLREYAAAIRRLQRVQAEVDVTRAANPYPELDC